MQKWFFLVILTSQISCASSKGIDLRLHTAAADGNQAKVEKLLQSGLSANSLNQDQYPPVYFAFDLEDETIALLLLQKMDLSLKSGELKENLLFLAIRKNQPQSVQFLLKKKPDLIHEKTTGGMSPLMIASRYSTPEIVSALLASGAEPNEKNSFGSTALDMAQKAQNKSVVEILKNHLKKKESSIDNPAPAR